MSSLVPNVQRILGRRVITRAYATELPRPPPPTHQPITETFSDTSRPRPYYVNHPPFRDLPKTPRRWPIILAAGIVSVSSWAGFMTYVTNQEMLSSSVFRSIMRSVRAEESLRDVLGDAIRPQPEWWLNGDPRIKGKIGQLQGNIDVSFRIKGTKGAGTLYFTSIRREKGAPFQTLRFKVICDDGTVVHVENASQATSQ